MEGKTRTSDGAGGNFDDGTARILDFWIGRCVGTHVAFAVPCACFQIDPLWTWETHVQRGRSVHADATGAGLAAGVPEPAFAMFVAGFFHDAGAGGEGDAEQHEQGEQWAHDDVLPNAAGAGYRRGGSKMWRGL